MTSDRDSEAEAAILRLVGERGPDKSICPTDAARVLGKQAWRSHLGRVRAAAVELARSGRIEILRKGKPVELHAVGGVIRLRLRSARASSEEE